MKYSTEEMKAKWAEFDAFLNQIDKDYAGELKQKGGIRRYAAYGVWNNRIMYTPDKELPVHIEKLLRAKLLELFP